MKIDRSAFFALVAAIAGTACSSAASPPGDGGALDGSGGAGDGASARSDGGDAATCPVPCAGVVGGCCTFAQTCLNGACCANPCGGACCVAGAVCLDDGLGNKKCATGCTDSTQCPAAAPCCGPAAEGLCGSIGSTWACMPMTLCAGEVCRCTTGASCTATGVCAPFMVSTNPVGPYVCKANDGKAYDGCDGDCLGTGHCPNAPGDDCYNVGGNTFCGKGCSIDSDCGDPGIVCCKPATCGNCINSCRGAGVCGPC
jgi:hypothetical protein